MYSFRYVLFIFSFLFSQVSTAQSTVLADSMKAMALNKAAIDSLYSNPDAELRIANESLEFSRKMGFKNGVINGLGLKGLIYTEIGDVQNALSSYNLALQYSRDYRFPTKEASVLNNLGLVYG